MTENITVTHAEYWSTSGGIDLWLDRNNSPLIAQCTTTWTLSDRHSQQGTSERWQEWPNRFSGPNTQHTYNMQIWRLECQPSVTTHPSLAKTCQLSRQQRILVFPVAVCNYPPYRVGCSKSSPFRDEQNSEWPRIPIHSRHMCTSCLFYP